MKFTGAAQQRTKTVGKSWDVFTKQVFVEKHISGIMYENPRGPRSPCSRYQRP